jgi:zinc/manganese transport system substrate-binding protein
MRYAFAGFLFLTGAWTGCLAKSLEVVSLSTITTDLVSNVGRELVHVEGLVKAGIDPHEFQPTPIDIKKISRADLVLSTGKGMDGYLGKLKETVGDEGKFIEVGQTLPSLQMKQDGKEMLDPHWWHSIVYVERAILVIRDALIKADPVHRVDFEKNTVAYLKQLQDLSQWAKKELSLLPREKRQLVTSHDALQYFAHDFGFRIHPVEGISTADQPSSRKVADLIHLIKAQGVKAIFAENIENPKVLAEITRETGARLGGELYVDGLGDREARTYLEMVKHNVTTIVNHLK